jgi:hypothetical protein
MTKAVLLVLAATATIARADDRSAMTEYFDGEITGGWTLMGMGGGGVVAGGILIADGGDRARGASYVTFGFGAAHLAAGTYINVASRVRKRAYHVAPHAERSWGIVKAPDAWRTLERARMAGVSKQFLVLKIVEVALIAGGGTMAIVGNTTDRPQLEGAGYALAAEAAATLVFDIVAARRAGRYRARLAEDANGQPVVLVGATLTF